MTETRATALEALARRLVDEGTSRGIPLRLIGSIAVRELCAGREDILERLDREQPVDIDLVGYLKQQPQIALMFKQLGYRIDPTIAQSQEWGIQRLIYYAPDSEIKVDIFLDVLRMSHTIDFKDRLPSTSITVIPVDLLLAKLQVFQITEKDLKDVVALLLLYALGDSAGDAIDVGYLLARLRGDWGLSYTVLKNIALVADWMDAQRGLNADEAAVVRARLLELRRRIETEPKSLRWRMRAAIGSRLRWYEEVGDVDR